MKKLLAVSAVVFAFCMGAGVVPQNVPFVSSAIMVAQAAEAEEVTVVGYGALPQGVPMAQAKMMARRAAVMDAQRNLLEAIKGVAVDAESTMNNYLLQSDVVKTKISGIVQGARIVSEGLNMDGGYEVAMTIPKYGSSSLASVVIPQKLASEGVKTPVPIMTPPPAAVQSYNAVGDYTGVVIDAQGLPLDRTFCPVIYDTNGRAIYGVKNVNADYAISKGVVEYAEGLDRWQQVDSGNSRAGSKPLVVKAVELRQRAVNKCDVVVSVEDADKILVENQRSGILNKYAVVFEK